LAAPVAPAAAPRTGLRPGLALLLAVLGVALSAPRLAGPFTDGQAGNCGAMFALFERNAGALGLLATRGVPVVNPVAPDGVERAEFYAHHPPGLPWLVVLAVRTSGLPVETASRLVALASFLLSTLLLADLAARLSGHGAALAAGLLMLLLPAGRHDATLVNYETVAVPALLALLRALRLGRGRPWLAAAAAALLDWVALLPLLFGPGAAGRRAWWRAVGAAGLVLLAFALLVRSVAPAAAGGTAVQALGATFLAPDFEARAWLAALRTHPAALYGWALVPAALGLLAWTRLAQPLRGVLLALLAVGALNVLVFARHATGHEHFWLMLQPWVALSTATLLFPGTPAGGPPRALALAVLAGVLAAAARQAARQAPERTRTTQAELADRFAREAPEQAVFVRPAGAPLVFLQRAQRHVLPTPAASIAAALAAASDWRTRFGLPATWPVLLVLADGEPAPPWSPAPHAPAVGEGFTFIPLAP
jgi:hypothetical protein